MYLIHCFKRYVCAQVLYLLTGTCQFGDKASWCGSYVRGPEQCRRSEVARLCCHACAQHFTTTSTTSSETLPVWSPESTKTSTLDPSLPFCDPDATTGPPLPSEGTTRSYTSTLQMIFCSILLHSQRDQSRRVLVAAPPPGRKKTKK